VKKFFNWILVLGAIVGAFYGIGLIVPRNQTQGSKTTMTAKPDQIFKVLSDVSTWSQWNPEVASVQERSRRDDHMVWFVTDKEARSYEMEVTLEEDKTYSWQGTYTLDGTRFGLRFDIGWFAEGGRVRVTKTSDTREVWQRARRFLLPTHEVSAIAVLNALAEHLGEPSTAEEN